MRAYQMVVFDMAGTTISEDNLVYKTLTNSLNKYGFHVDLNIVLLYGAGKEKLQAIKDIINYSQGDITNAEDVYSDFKINLEESYNTMPVKPFDDAEKTCKHLKDKGVKVVLNTGYDTFTANLLLNRIGWQVGNQIDFLVTADDVPRSRPFADMISLAMQEFQITDATTVIKVGDSAIDIEEGKNAKCGLTIGITTGAQTKEQLLTASPDYIVDSLYEIIAFIN